MELGTDELFAQLIATTQPKYRLNRVFEDQCLAVPLAGGVQNDATRSPDEQSPDPEVVVKQDSIGPFDYAVLRADDRDEMFTWLTENHYFIPGGTVANSVVAGITTGFYESRLPAGSPVIRVMPNAPALVGAGVSALAKGRFATDEHLGQASTLFESVGAVVTVPESQLDAVTAVSGSGPAYFYLFVEALVDAAVANGLQRAIATDLVAQTMAGSAAMLLERIDDERTAGTDTGLDTTPARLRAMVTSPAGTTAAGLRELERGAVRAAVTAAVDAAKTRSEQLGITSE